MYAMVVYRIKNYSHDQHNYQYNGISLIHFLWGDNVDIRSRTDYEISGVFYAKFKEILHMLDNHKFKGFHINRVL